MLEQQYINVRIIIIIIEILAADVTIYGNKFVRSVL